MKNRRDSSNVPATNPSPIALVQIRLQKPHVRSPSLVVLNRKARTRMCIWCRRRDLNPHGLRHTPLKRACLPFHHFGTQQELEKHPQLRSRIAQTLNVLSRTPRAFARCGLVARLFEAPATEDAETSCHAVPCPRFTNDMRLTRGSHIIEVGQNPCQSIEAPVESGGSCSPSPPTLCKVSPASLPRSMMSLNDGHGG